MKRAHKLAAATISVYLALNGCSPNDKVLSLVAVGGGALSPAVITTSMQGARAASQILQTEELFYNSILLLKIVGSKAIDVMVNDPAVSSTTPVSCADYGDYKYTGSVNASGNFSLTLTFALCRENGFQFDGDFTVNGTPAGFSGAFGGGFRIVDFSDNSYSAITGTLAPSLQFTMAGSRSSSLETYTIAPQGSITTFDYVMLGQFRVLFSGLQADYSMSINAATSDKTTTININGNIGETWTGGSLRLTLTDFNISKIEYFSAAGPPPVYFGSNTMVSGSAAYDFSAGFSGLEGMLSVMMMTPIHHDYSTGATTAGAMTLMGNGSATVQYNPAGDIDVSAAGAAPLNFGAPGEYFLAKVVNIYGLEQTPPKFMGNAGTLPSAAALGSSWPSTMTVTALSSGPDLTCYTDVHVLYFSPADLVLVPPVITWYVDWNINLVDSCAPPTGIPFEEARDVTGDTSCDAGLDINGAEQDYSSGGVEHFTATALPEGYYVLSINNYSCDTTVSNMASIIIGDYLFGTYNCSYSDVDGDGSSPGAWCRLADMRVNADSSVDVLAPNPSINPWH